MLHFLLLKHSWRNLPRCRTSFSLLFFIILINCSLSLEHISSTSISRSNKKRSSAWKGHTSIKCSSSSISLVLQKRHVLCDASSFGFWCLPVSIRNICEMVTCSIQDSWRTSKYGNIQEGAYLQRQNCLVTESPKMSIKINRMAIKFPIHVIVAMSHVHATTVYLI